MSEFGAARFFARTGEGIYDMDDLARATAKMLRFVKAHKASHPNSPAYGFRYSNGANILAAVSMTAPGLFERIGLLHPLIPWSPAPVAGLDGSHVLITAGRHDPITPWAESERLMQWYLDQGVKLSTHVHDGGHELRPGEVDALASLLAD